MNDLTFLMDIVRSTPFKFWFYQLVAIVATDLILLFNLVNPCAIVIALGVTGFGLWRALEACKRLAKEFSKEEEY